MWVPGLLDATIVGTPNEVNHEMSGITSNMVNMLFDNLYFVGIFIGALAGQGFFSIYQGRKLVRMARSSRNQAALHYQRSLRLGVLFLLFSLILLIIFGLGAIIMHKSIVTFLLGAALMFLLYVGLQIFMHR